MHYTTTAIFVGAMIRARNMLFLTQDTDISHKVSLILTGENGVHSHTDLSIRYANVIEGVTVVMMHKRHAAGVVGAL